MQMPGCDGLEATRKIREWEAQNANINKHYICALTAHANRCAMDLFVLSTYASSHA
jgi:CheY-like chemotaxis protein